MNIPGLHDLPKRLAERLTQPLPGPRGQARFAPELAYGRHTGPPAHDARLAAVVVLLVPTQCGWRLPLMLRPKDAPSHAGQICFPGGVVEKEESSQDCALRELEEELAVARSEVDILGKLSPIYIFVTNYLVIPYLAIAAAQPKYQPSPKEVAEVVEASLEDICDSTSHGVELMRRHKLRFQAPYIGVEGKRIWGATSMMLGELITLIEEL